MPDTNHDTAAGRHKKPLISMVIPARNEEKYLPGMLDSVRPAMDKYNDKGGSVEIIVVDNKSTDRTAEIAIKFGCKVKKSAANNIAGVRNDGATDATGEIITFADADNKLHPNTFIEIQRTLENSSVIGGGVDVYLDRRNLETIISEKIVKWIVMKYMGLGGGLYYTYKKDFEAIGGFNEDLYAGEDLDFAEKLKKHGEKTSRKFKNLMNIPMITSARKFKRVRKLYLLKLLLLTITGGRCIWSDPELFKDMFYNVEKLR